MYPGAKALASILFEYWCRTRWRSCRIDALKMLAPASWIALSGSTSSHSSNDGEETRLLLQVGAHGHVQRSLVLTHHENLGIFRWGSVFGYGVLTAAVIERLIHNGQLLQRVISPQKLAETITLLASL